MQKNKTSKTCDGNLAELGLPERVNNILRNAGMKSVSELNSCNDYTTLKYIGKKTAHDIEMKLKRYNNRQDRNAPNKNKDKTLAEKQGIKKDSFIDERFFPDSIRVDTTRIFPVVVMATMSSGKSTLINALLGEDILPNQNEACTAKMFSILDDDSAKKTTLYVTKKDGKLSKSTTKMAERLKEANESDDVASVLITGDIKGVVNTDKSLLIIDTPGPNNARDLSHVSVMKEILGRVSGGLILYVINATQMGIVDDAKLLKELSEQVKAKENLNVLFVINKMDAIDYDKESAYQFMQETIDYLSDNQFSESDIIPVSARAANLFKKAMLNTELTRKEYRDFIECYDMFRTSDLNMRSYIRTRDFSNQMTKIDIKGVEYMVADIEAAIENTGITALEDYIQKKQIDSSKQSSLKVRTGGKK